MQAVILAAGMGKRLGSLTRDNTKCMVKVNGITLIERMLKQLDCLGLSGIIIVIGYKGGSLRNFVETIELKTPLRFVNNEKYDETNNIYSLYLTKKYLIAEDTLLFESDLIFDSSLPAKLLENPKPCLALVAGFESWMNGTVVTLDRENRIKNFLSPKEFVFENISSYYKTVNIYKFSREFAANYYIPALEANFDSLGMNEYYEQVLKVIALLDSCSIEAVVLNDENWFEIDDAQDLDMAESIFGNRTERFRKLQNRFGGYWRYPKLIDFQYLTNPYFPGRNLLDEMKAGFENLLTNYPSGMQANCLLAARYFKLRRENICIGNGAAELIKPLMLRQPGKIGMVFPGFEEYCNCTGIENVVGFISGNADFSYSADDLINYFAAKDITSLVISNPDNPSGNFIEKREILKLADWAGGENIGLIIDESFIDFADTAEDMTLLVQDLLDKYPNLTVLRSISKSFGVPGIRLGIMGSSNTELIDDIKRKLAIWNINSFGEFFLQIIEKYRNDYVEAIEQFKETRRDLYRELETLNSIRVIPSQGNFIMFELIGGIKATCLAEELLDEYNILVKDLSLHRGLSNRQCVRVAVKKPDENKKLISALREIFERKDF
ncbi:MAG: aminotransferase class I/II-fold pyridoxal phosphate-dependent enzyme [Victivallaceae bacterium]|nr:aminotransferase class I/II-fold pyridoxal phosphate-dependent enzyme [Victivallaceae bacterium]